MKCPKCQFENAEGIKFCGECGNKLDIPAETSPNDLSFDEKIAKIQKYLPKGLTEKILIAKRPYRRRAKASHGDVLRYGGLYPTGRGAWPRSCLFGHGSGIRDTHSSGARL